MGTQPEPVKKKGAQTEELDEHTVKQISEKAMKANIQRRN